MKGRIKNTGERRATGIKVKVQMLDGALVIAELEASAPEALDPGEVKHFETAFNGAKADRVNDIHAEATWGE
ncbi:MAG: FxLYD domain-containing protein [Planctomycetota bacterium]